MGDLFDSWYEAGRHTYVISILPFDIELNQAYWGWTKQSGALDRIENWYNPWLEQQALEREWTYVDAWAIQDQPDWVANSVLSHRLCR